MQSGACAAARASAADLILHHLHACTPHDPCHLPRAAGGRARRPDAAPHCSASCSLCACELSVPSMHSGRCSAWRYSALWAPTALLRDQTASGQQPRASCAARSAHHGVLSARAAALQDAARWRARVCRASASSGVIPAGGGRLKWRGSAPGPCPPALCSGAAAVSSRASARDPRATLAATDLAVSKLCAVDCTM